MDADNGNFTFLQYCADRGYDKLVKFLLDKGAAPNRTCKNNRRPPLVLAGHHGYHRVIQAFKDLAIDASSNHEVNFAAKDKTKMENILHVIVKAESRSSVNAELRDYDECLNILLLDDRDIFRKLILPAVNATEKHYGNTPL